VLALKHLDCDDLRALPVILLALMALIGAGMTTRSLSLTLLGTFDFTMTCGVSRCLFVRMAGSFAFVPALHWNGAHLGATTFRDF
jgi:hypothetical protein